MALLGASWWASGMLCGFDIPSLGGFLLHAIHIFLSEIFVTVSWQTLQEKRNSQKIVKKCTLLVFIHCS